MTAWTDVGARADFVDGRPRLVRIEGRRIAVLVEGDVIRAFDDLCPHASDPLTGGYPFEGSIVCRAHGWRYDLTNGECLLGDRTSRLPIHEARLHQGRVEISLR